MTGNTLRGEGGPFAIVTALGWVLSGSTGVSDSAASLNVYRYMQRESPMQNSKEIVLVLGTRVPWK